MTMKEIQPRSSFGVYGVNRGPTDLKLPGGQTVPFYYALSVRSTCPYVRYLGGSQDQKVFSWNEIIMVPPGQLVTVYSDTYHRGDIVINSGRDPAALPSRITVPVGMVDNGANWVPQWPLDCRRAHRAFLTGFRATVGANVTFTITNRQRAGSWDFNPAEAIVTDPQPGIVETRVVPPSVKLDPVPLGINANATDTVHGLADTVTFMVSNNAPIAVNGSLAYVLEYS